MRIATIARKARYSGVRIDMRSFIDESYLPKQTLIGLAFALRGTFGKMDGIEHTALCQVLEKFAHSRGMNVDAAALERTATQADFARPVHADLRSIFLSALGPRMLHEIDNVVLESMFRAEAARLARDRFVSYDDVATTLAEVTGLNLPCAALGDGWPSIDRRIAEAVGFHGPIVFTEDHDIDATSPVAFGRLAEALALPADRIWFVGTDPLGEIVPALAQGMHAIWIDRDGEAYPEATAVPDATVTSFAGLLDVIGERRTRGLLGGRPGRFP